MDKLNLVRTVETDSCDVVTVVTGAHSTWSKGWLAELVSLQIDAFGGESIDRVFVNPSEKNLSRAGNGEKVYTGLRPGLYEADSVWRSYASHRTVFTVDEDGTIHVLANSNDGDTAQAAKNWLKVAGRIVERVLTPAQVAAVENKHSAREQAATEQAVKAATERDRQERIWAKKKSLCERIIALCPILKGEKLKIWNGGREVRIYIGEFGNNIVTYYHTGNRYNKPGAVEIASSSIRDKKEELCSILEEVCKNWTSLTLTIEE